MELLCRQERKIFAQIETRLCPENRQCAGTRAIAARLAMLEHEPEKIMILAHARNYLLWRFAKIKKCLL
jgi:hypothetical protein